MNKFLFAVCMIAFVAFGIVGAPHDASAQGTAIGSYTGSFFGTTGLHPGVVSLPTAPFLNGMASYRISRSSAAAWADTVYCKGYDSTCTVFITREGKPARKPGLVDNAPYFGYATGNYSIKGAKRDYFTMTYMVADTLTFDILIRKPVK